MAATKIEWADKTWNPITGCSKTSEGCLNCFAQAFAKRLAKNPKLAPETREKYEGFKIALHQDRFEQPRKWKKPQRIFLGSMTDLFQDEIREKDLDWIFEVIEDCPQHTFMVLTKRPENIEQKLWGFDPGQTAACGPMRQFQFHGELPENLWIGVTAENQARADERIPVLLAVPGIKVRFVSVEPMLGPVFLCKECKGQRPSMDLRELKRHQYHSEFGGYGSACSKNFIDWVICGGETGPGAREMDIEWARSLRDQCFEADTPFFFKSHGSKSKLNGNILDGKIWQQFPN